LRAAFDPGDLVLLKGSLYADSFDVMTELRASDSHPDDSHPERQAQGRLPAGGTPALAVGLGNAGAQFRDTPHNVGYRAVEALAARAGAPWERLGDALVARFERDGHATYLAKLETQVNRSGPALLAVSHALGAGASDLMILVDDINLPVGRTRVRFRGSDGGHRGVRSVLSSFGTDEVARVKIGVGPVPDTTTAMQHVLAPFAPGALRQVDADCCRAGDAVLQWLAGRPGGAMVEEGEGRPGCQAGRAGPPPEGRAMTPARGGSSPGGPSLS
jgi:peptidyl-tRNA hydrolase, PTH1 family